MFLNTLSLNDPKILEIIATILGRLKMLMPYMTHPCTAAIGRQVPGNVSKILKENEENEKPLSVQELIDIVKTAGFKEEPMRTLDGKIILKELLINFGSIPEKHRKTIFSELKKHSDGTFLLFCLSLEAAKERILRGEAVSINAFVEDFDHRDLYTTMMNFFITGGINPHLLTIELLEDHEQKELSLGIIKQIKRVESLGIHLAIDDYSFGSEKSAHIRNQSRLIMLSLMGNNVPFRIKIDGGIVSAVFPIEGHRNIDGNSMKEHYPSLYDEQRVGQRNTIISEIKSYLEAGIIVVLEWVTPEQLSILRDTFGSTQNADTHLLLQGMELEQEHFE